MKTHTWKWTISQNPSKSEHVVSFSPRLNSQLSTSPSNCLNLSAMSSLVWPTVVRMRSLADSNEKTAKYVYLGPSHRFTIDLSKCLKSLEFVYCLSYVLPLQICDTIQTERSYPNELLQTCAFQNKCYNLQVFKISIEELSSFSQLRTLTLQ